MSLATNPDAVTLSFRDRAATFGLSSDEFTQVVTYLGREPNALEARGVALFEGLHRSSTTDQTLLLPSITPARPKEKTYGHNR